MGNRFVFLSLTACINDNSAPKAEKQTTVFDSQLNALDKTRNIENVLQQRADHQQGDLDIK